MRTCYGRERRLHGGGLVRNRGWNMNSTSGKALRKSNWWTEMEEEDGATGGGENERDKQDQG